MQSISLPFAMRRFPLNKKYLLENFKKKHPRTIKNTVQGYNSGADS